MIDITVHISTFDSNRVYLSGNVSGLDRSREYCLKWRTESPRGAWKNLPSGASGYTYIHTADRVDIGNLGAYFPIVSGVRDYRVKVFGVSGTCDAVVALYDDEVVRIPETPPTPPTPTPPFPGDPCAGVVCSNKCVGTDLYSQHCYDGECVTGGRLERHAEMCGYEEAPPVYEKTSVLPILLLVGGAVGMYLMGWLK